MSNYNPYAAPAADHAAAVGGGVLLQGEPQPWDVGDAVKSGWEIYKAHWAPLTFGYFVVTLIGMVPQQAAPVLAKAGVLEESSRTYFAVHVPLMIIAWLIGEFFMAGFIHAALRAVRTRNATFGDFFAAGGRFVPFVVMSFLKFCAIFFGFVLLIVPGVILMLGFANASFYVIDQNLGPIAALKASWESSDGQKGNLFLLGLAEIGVTLLGLLACCLGIFVAVPVMFVARAIVYTKMSGTAPPPVAPAGAYAPGYGGGYGPPGTYGISRGYGPPGSGSRW